MTRQNIFKGMVKLSFVLISWAVIQQTSLLSWKEAEEDYLLLFMWQNYLPLKLPEEFKEEQCLLSSECRELARAIVFESRSETDEGQKAVASVILNRVDDEGFPDTIKEVIHQPRQFSFLADMHLQSRPSKKDWTKAYSIAYDMKHGIEERVTDATFYLNPNNMDRLPRWARKFQHVATIGRHNFYKP